MGIYFLDEDRNDLCNPASGTARVFHAQVTSVALLLNVETGLGPIEQDQVVIDRKKYAAFNLALAEKLGIAPDLRFEDLLERGRRLVG